MAKLDAYLKGVKQFKAAAVLLKSNRNVTLRFADGDKQAAQKTTHENLVQIVEEIAPVEDWNKIQGGMNVKFKYESDGHTYGVTVSTHGNNWMLIAEDMTSPQKTVMPQKPVAPPIVKSKLDTSQNASASLLDKLLRHMKNSDASDLHLTTGAVPMMRQHGSMVPIEGVGELQPDVLLRELMAIAPETNREEFERDNDTDYAYEIKGLSRFRVNVFRDRMGPGAVLRTIPFQIPDAMAIGVPKEVLKLCNLTKGLVLVTGPTGSGKSTTLASLIDYINQTRDDHIITIEDPVEFIHPNKRCLVNQREIHTHTNSFKRALRAALREDPDIVLVGEMRDLETIEIAVETAETGHLVFGTLHTTTAPGTVDRIIDQFPTDRQEQIRMMLSESLAGVISQVLCKKIGGGRVAAYEILLGNNAVSNLIREKKTFQLFSLMQTSKNQGMRTMTASLMELVNGGKVTAKEAYMKANNKGEIKMALERAGVKIDFQT